MDGYQVALAPVPQGTDDLKNLADYVQNEYNKIQAILAQVEQGALTVRNVLPPRPRRGTFVYADGTNWNPVVNGEGPVFFDGTYWHAVVHSPTIHNIQLRYNWSWDSLKMLADVSYELYLGSGGLILTEDTGTGAPGTPLVGPFKNLLQITPTQINALNGSVQWDSTLAELRLTLDSAKIAFWNVALSHKWELQHGLTNANDGTLFFYDRTNTRSVLEMYSTGIVKLPFGQLQWPGTPNFTTDVNTIDDFKRGTWTPGLTFTTPGDLSITPSVAVGDYYKIGKWVVASFRYNSSGFSFTTASGNLTITGLPYTPSSDTNFVWPGPLTWGGITKAGYTNICCEMVFGTSTGVLTASGSGVAPANVTAADMPSGGTVRLRGTFIYRT